MAQAPSSIPIYCRTADKHRLARMAELETRSQVDQLSVVIREACESRGIDPDNLAPIETPEARDAPEPVSTPAPQDAPDA